MGYCISRKKTGKENSQYLGYRALHKLMFVCWMMQDVSGQSG